MTDLALKPSRMRAWSAGLRRVPGLMVFSYAFFGLVLVCAIAGPALAPHAAGAQNLLLGVTPPGAGAIFGTDELGRDVFSRVIVGANTAVTGPVVIAVG